MSITTKYNRTYHYDFSPGTTSDDRINHEWKSDIIQIPEIIHLEKLDGENRCLNEFGVFARSHVAPTRNPWANHIKGKWDLIRRDLKNVGVELFGEDLYAQQSIIYPNIESHFYMFAVRKDDMWLSWDEVKWYAEFFEFPLVPELEIHDTKLISTKEIQNYVISESNKPSVFGSIQVGTDLECTREGIVTRNIGEFNSTDFRENVFKYVRKNHVQTNEHWSRAWTRSPLKWEHKKK